MPETLTPLAELLHRCDRIHAESRDLMALTEERLSTMRADLAENHRLYEELIRIVNRRPWPYG